MRRLALALRGKGGALTATGPRDPWPGTPGTDSCRGAEFVSSIPFSVGSTSTM